MPLTSAQITTLTSELNNDPEALGYAPFIVTTDVDSLIELLTHVRDGVTPDPINGVIGPSGTITNATNATPIVVTSTAHGRATGDSVVIAGVGGNTAANGTWTITVLSANMFSLSGSAGNGAYTSGGTWNWCVAGVRNQSITTQQLIGAIAFGDLITAGQSTAMTANQEGIFRLAGALFSDGQIALVNPDGTDNNNAKTLKQLVTNPSASRTAIIALETRLGSRIEQLLSLSGVVPSEADLHAALGK